MEGIILDAVERNVNVNPKQCRKAGFTPGVLYGESVTNAIPVQFETAVLKKVLATHGPSAKVWVNYGNNKKFGIIREVQRQPVSAEVIHIDVYLVSQEDEIKMKIPILFEGRDELKDALLQVYKTEVEVFGKANLMPNVIVVDLSTMAVGDAITAKNFELDKQIKITDNEEEVYGILISHRKVTAEAEAVTEAEVEAETETEA
jgi:large subunit ribosomal protein L25